MSKKKMTREQCERLLLKKLHDIKNIYLQYNPDGKYLTLVFATDERGDYFQFNNRYWEDGEDVNIPISYSEIVKPKEGAEGV